MLFAVLAYVTGVFSPLGLMLLNGAQGRAPISVAATGLTLVSFAVLSLQPVLAARLRTLDRLFGLDSIYILHKTMGMAGAVLLLCSLAVLGAAGGEWGSHAAGITACGILSVLGITAFLHAQLGMTYESWRSLHNVLALSALVAAFIEALLLAGSFPVRAVCTALFLAGLGAYTSHRIIGPAIRRKHPYRVRSVTNEARNVWTIALEPPDGAPLDHLPGQFQFLTFDGGRGEEHPFTISTSPGSGVVHASTIKGSGDFTRTIGSVRPGDTVGVQAPFGRFSYVLHPDEKDLVLIAGGIGITPFMSMLRHMRDTNADKDVLLLYANNTEEDIVFRRELDEIASGRAPRLRVVHVLGKPGGDWQGERGSVGNELIGKYCPDGLANKAFWLCGPPPMMTALIALLIGHGVPSRRVRSERFAL